MNEGDLILFIIKLVLGGAAAFLAIFLWSKTRDVAWMTLVAGVVFSYAGVVFDMMLQMGFVSSGGIPIFGVPIVKLFFAVIPSVFVIVAFVLMILRNR